MSALSIILAWLCLGLVTSRVLSARLGLQAGEKPQRAEREPTSVKRHAEPRDLLTLHRKVLALEEEQEELEEELEKVSNGGSLFVRWGRKSCPHSDQLVYSGVAGGSLYSSTGAAANRLCLTSSPRFDNTPVPAGYGYLYGAEYDRIPGHHNHDVPCSLCRTAQSTTVMIPATRYCPSGWTTQYSGFLSTGHPRDKAASEYVCLDRYPEHAAGGITNHNGNMFYLTVTRCGSLPCPPFIKNKVVLCVVCSK